ncbi:MAG: hypothetical protein E3J56_14480 [Candidatus Aminicenantes bacterium]|nr:MAG: hypothetical protein E3J56_14480 [Candidatus Aminicenantes bacterium]
MKILRGNSHKKIMVVALVLFIFVYAAAPSLQANAGCVGALRKCSVDAVIALIFAGPHAFLLYYSGCLMGYTWCLKYYV